MLRPSTWTAQQLRSVALRYQHALARERGAARWPAPNGRRREAAQPVKEAAASAYRRDEKLARVEAVLFVAHEPLSSRKIAQFASLADGTEARTLIRRLNRFYDLQANAFRVEQVAGGFQILTRPKFGGWLRRLHQSPVETQLSAPAMETLAVVAYRQAVPRAEIESIRGVQCGEILRQLIERGLVRMAGRSEELGRPFLYGTTKRFLERFGLRSLDDLPRAAALRRKTTDNDEPSHEIATAARRDDELTPMSDLNEESEVKKVANLESARFEPSESEPWKVAGAAAPVLPSAAAKEEGDDLADDAEDDDFDDDDDYDDEEDDLDDEEDLDDEDDDDDLDDEEWEEVDDDDDWEDDDDEDWDEDDDDEDDEEEWEDE